MNAHYLTVDPTNWVDTEVRIQGELPGSPSDTESFRAVQSIRPPILQAADTILRTNPEIGGLHRREQEARFLDSLTPIVSSLIGVPLLDIAGHALAGLDRII